MGTKTCNCENCSKPIFGRYYKEVGSKKVCDYCVELKCQDFDYFQCDGCDAYFDADHAGYSGGISEPWYCEVCAEAHVTACGECGEPVLCDKAQYANGGCYCPLCAPDMDED